MHDEMFYWLCHLFVEFLIRCYLFYDVVISSSNNSLHIQHYKHLVVLELDNRLYIHVSIPIYLQMIFSIDMCSSKFWRDKNFDVLMMYPQK